MNDPNDPLVALRRDFYYAQAAHFLSIFHPVFHPLFIDDSGNYSHKVTTGRVLSQLEWTLSFATEREALEQPFRAIASHLPSIRIAESFLLSLLKEYRKREMTPPFRYEDDADVLTLTVQQRSRLLFDLIQMISKDSTLFRALWEQYLRDGQERWRSDAVGVDSRGFVYYVLGDGRLYRLPCKLKDAGDDECCDDWELISAGRTEWERFLTDLKGKKGRDANLYKTLNVLFNQLTDLHEEMMAEERQLAKHAELVAAPRKRSSRLQAVKEAEEERARTEAEKREIERKEEKERRDTEAVLPLVTSSPEQKMSREARIRQRELKKLVAQQQEILEEATNDHVPNGQPEEAGEQKSPLKLVFKRNNDGLFTSSLLVVAAEPSVHPIDSVQRTLLNDRTATDLETASVNVTNTDKVASHVPPVNSPVQSERLENGVEDAAKGESAAAASVLAELASLNACNEMISGKFMDGSLGG